MVIYLIGALSGRLDGSSLQLPAVNSCQAQSGDGVKIVHRGKLHQIQITVLYSSIYCLVYYTYV